MEKEPDPDRWTFELSPEDIVKVNAVVDARHAIPVSHVILREAWTEDGYEMRMYEHVQDIPPELCFGPIAPGQATEVTGWPCPACESTRTSCWGCTNNPLVGDFTCDDCGATGGMNMLDCRRRPAPIHLNGPCDCWRPSDEEEPPDSE